LLASILCSRAQTINWLIATRVVRIHPSFRNFGGQLSLFMVLKLNCSDPGYRWRWPSDYGFPYYGGYDNTP
jgi:hypothetical protein